MYILTIVIWNWKKNLLTLLGYHHSIALHCLCPRSGTIKFASHLVILKLQFIEGSYNKSFIFRIFMTCYWTIKAWFLIIYKTGFIQSLSDSSLFHFSLLIYHNTVYQWGPNTIQFCVMSSVCVLWSNSTLGTCGKLSRSEVKLFKKALSGFGQREP